VIAAVGADHGLLREQACSESSFLGSDDQIKVFVSLFDITRFRPSRI